MAVIAPELGLMATALVLIVLVMVDVFVRRRGETTH